MFLLNLVKSALQTELDHFFKVLHGNHLASRVVSKAAFCLARQKLCFTAFQALNARAIDAIYSTLPYRRWHNLRLLAVDSSTLRLPNTPEVRREFAQIHETHPQPLARISTLFDVLNGFTLDAVMTPMNQADRNLAEQHCHALRPNDLVLLDRGYPAFWLFALLQKIPAHFCVRINEHWHDVRAFIASGQYDHSLTLYPGEIARTDCRRKRVSTSPLNVRLVRVDLPSGEIEVLMTSLTDTSRYPTDLFADLYHRRWGIEENYKATKLRVQVENFSGKSVLAVKQDFFAKMLSQNLAALLAWQAQTHIDAQPKKTKHARQVNFTQALSNCKDALVLLICRAKRAPDIIRQIVTLFIQTTEPVRPGRQYPRNIPRYKPKRFAVSYKPCR